MSLRALLISLPLSLSLALALAFAVGGGGARAGEADVVAVKVTKTGDRVYRFDVTLRHDDTGWQHYADAWQVLGPDGAVLGTRTLVHPHVDEQPFTRRLSGVRIPAGIAGVRLRARDKVHGHGGVEQDVPLPD
ncbi:MAG: hypothetical protein QF578_20345 [Alphaproteobacteria bacterium]|nr:hypothetical protein [Alphaproteobacteria bacterium]MDP6567190.1 hypothetical protein [Alphaproteobacteria bacterium]MDP6815404.1 hypothetical protein [Alphaproteobacteria bacterium]